MKEGKTCAFPLFEFCQLTSIYEFTKTSTKTDSCVPSLVFIRGDDRGVTCVHQSPCPHHTPGLCVTEKLGKNWGQALSPSVAKTGG